MADAFCIIESTGDLDFKTSRRGFTGLLGLVFLEIRVWPEDHQALERGAHGDIPGDEQRKFRW